MAQDSWNSRDQEETGCQPPQGPILCANNCGFFGSATTMNLCSKCYQDFVVVEAKATEGTKVAAAAAAAAAAVTVKVVVVETPSSSHPSQAGLSVKETAPLPPPPPSSKPQPNRCLSCRKRVGLAGFTCRCGDVFCSTHRYSDKHNCQFDYHAAAQEAIAKANPVVKAEKLDKI